LQKLETLWKMLNQTAWAVDRARPSGPPAEANMGYSPIAPITSAASAMNTTKMAARVSLPSGSAASISPSAAELRNDRLLPTTIASTVPNSMMPSPPSWIRARMTTCPKRVKSSPVSRTTSPVTHVALTAVNRASG